MHNRPDSRRDDEKTDPRRNIDDEAVCGVRNAEVFAKGSVSVYKGVQLVSNDDP